MLKLIWKHIRKCLAMVRRTRAATRLDAAKTALRRTQKNRATRSCPPILYLDERIVDIGVLYRPVNEADHLDSCQRHYSPMKCDQHELPRPVHI